MLRVGLIGFGFAGRVFHAPVIRAVDGLRLTAIVQRSGQPDPNYRDVDFVRTLEDLLQRDIDLVVIAAPNQSHFPIARLCLQAGKHVVIDKPFTTTLAEAQELIALAQDKQVIISAYQNRRYVGDFLTVQKIIQSRELGRIVTYEAHFDRFRPEPKSNAWREKAQPGSGVWFDLGAHLLDQALVLFGTPEAITADIRLERESSEVDDAFDVQLRYPRMRALLCATVLAAAPGATFAVHGTKGSYVKYGLDPQEEALKSGRAPNEPDWDAEPPEAYGQLTTTEGQRSIPTLRSSFTHYYQNVRDAILGRAQLAVTPGQILNTMRGLELAAECSRRRCTLPWPT
jgi:predicted dehydrogenase